MGMVNMLEAKTSLSKLVEAVGKRNRKGNHHRPERQARGETGSSWPAEEAPIGTGDGKISSAGL